MQKPMSVMWIGLRGFPGVQGGIETHAEKLCPLLADRNCAITVVVRRGHQLSMTGNHWNGVRFRSLWAPRSQYLETIIHSFLALLYAAIKRPDILHVQGIGPSIITPIARLLGLRVVVTHHGSDYEREKWGRVAKSVLRAGEYLGTRFSNQRIVISRYIQLAMERKYRKDSVLIPNGVIVPDLQEKPHFEAPAGLLTRRYILVVTRLVPEKRHRDVIDAFLMASLPDWKLVFVGKADFEDAYAKSVLKAIEQSPGVLYAGLQTGNDLKQLYEHAGMFILPSSHEGLSFALLEAMSFGLPIIASDIEPNRMAGENHIRYFQVGDVAALCQQIVACAVRGADPELTKELRAFVEQRYCWSDIATRTYDVYRKVIIAARSEKKFS